MASNRSKRLALAPFLLWAAVGLALSASLHSEAATAADSAVPAPASSAVPSASAAPAPSRDVVTELILDASGSMKAKLGQRTKLFQAKRVLKAFMNQATNDNMVLGLRVYGLKEKDCKNSDLVFKFGEKGSDAVEAAMQAVDPKGYGKTPLAYSLQKAGEDLRKHPDKPRRIIVVSDGAETCGGDPCKVAKELKRELDVRIYVIGYSLDPGDKEQLKCMADGSGGQFFDANDLQSLLDALKALGDTSKNLFVKSPDPLGMSQLFEVAPGKPLQRKGQFVSSMGTRVEPDHHYEVHVMLQPTYEFHDVVVKPKEIKILEVKGTGKVTIQFMDQLFAVSLLDEKGKPVVNFPSDVATQVPVGFYKVKASSPPFAEAVIDDITVVPNGVYEEKIKGFGAVQLDSDETRGPGPFGYYVFDDNKKQDLGSYLTAAPLVLPMARYIMKTAGNGLLKNVYPEETKLKHIPIPPPGQTVTFARKEKPDKNEPKGPVFLHDLTPEQIEEHMKKMENKLK